MNALLALIVTVSLDSDSNFTTFSIKTKDTFLDRDDKLILRHYNESVRLLLDSNQNGKSKSSLRVVLITCIVFIGLECLRGHFTAAQSHLKSGLVILQSLNGESSAFVDDWITDAFIRYWIQFELWQMFHQHDCLPLPRRRKSAAAKQPREFFAAAEAWMHLQPMLTHALVLRQQAWKLAAWSPEFFALQVTQVKLLANLNKWQEAYDRSKLPESVGSRHNILLGYKIVTHVTALTAFQRDHLPNIITTLPLFLSLINILARLWKKADPPPAQKILGRRFAILARSMPELGWVPLLFFIAMACPVWEIRVRAVKLVGGVSHREGMWDSIITEATTRAVLKLEGNVSGEFEELGGTELGNPMAEEDLKLSSSETECKITELLAVFDNAQDFVVRLVYKRGEYWDQVVVNI